MGEHLTGPEHDQVPPLHPRIRKDTERRAKLIDLVHKSEQAPESGHQEDGFCLPPEHVFELFKGTEMEPLLPRPGEMAVDVLVEGLSRAGKFWTPCARAIPDNALLRRGVANPSPGRHPMRWQRSLGLVFQFDYRTQAGLVTADFEAGVALRGGCDIVIFTKGSVLVDGEIFMMGIPDFMETKVALIDEFLANIDNLTKPPTY